MGSKRKKAEKKKDFVKKKLKVGKTAAKPDNHTDTSFVSKTISLPNQTLNKKTVNGGTEHKEEVDLTHHLSLTRHHSSQTRKEVLNYIEQHLPSNPSLYKQILTSVTPLVLDESQSVRKCLVSLLTACAKNQSGLLDLHIKSLILFIHSAMTHIKPDVRNSSSSFLSVLVSNAPNSLARSYFIKTMKSYFALMSWALTDDKKSLSMAISTSSSIGGSTKNARIGHLKILRDFLKICIFPHKDENINELDPNQICQTHPLSYKYLVPDTTQPYTSLKLFVHEMAQLKSTGDDEKDSRGSGDGSFTINDLNTISAEDLDTRRKVMHDVFLKPLMKNLNNMIKEGGEVGRESNSCLAILNEFQQEFQQEKEDV